MKKIVALTGAGMSAESGIQTFRGAGGLWEGYDVMEVASPQGYARNPKLVLDFYNKRRRQLFKVKPNKAHISLAKLENSYRISIITQNVDDLHERAGSTDVLHIHGELLKSRSTKNPALIYDQLNDIYIGDKCEVNSQLRPHIVWFGEDVPMLEKATKITAKADMLIIIGTSMQVYPAAGLINFIKADTPIFYIDPNPSITPDTFNNLTIIQESATVGLQILIENYLNE